MHIDKMVLPQKYIGVILSVFTPILKTTCRAYLEKNSNVIKTETKPDPTGRFNTALIRCMFGMLMLPLFNQ